MCGMALSMPFDPPSRATEPQEGFAPKRERLIDGDVTGWRHAIARHFAKRPHKYVGSNSRGAVDQFLRCVPPSRDLHRHPASLGEGRKAASQANTWGSLSVSAIPFGRSPSVILTPPTRSPLPPFFLEAITDAIGCQRMHANGGVKFKTAGKLPEGPWMPSFGQ